jgi:XTP/dITP diphosphohydrolase
VKIVLATHNQGKVREIAQLMLGLPVEWSSASDFPAIPKTEESGDTLEENALLKAQALSQALGLPALADDSGLFVDALKGEPGVHSARYAGPDCNDADNVKKLLKDMADFAPDERGAAFRTVVAIVVPGETTVFLAGEIKGKITEKPKGTAGFGYDPVFEPEGDHRVFAEMSLEEKNNISHRARAFAKVRVWLEERLTIN